MYSSIHPKKAIESLMTLIRQHHLAFHIPLNKIENLLPTCIVKDSSFKVDNNYYNQIKVLKTDSPLSGLFLNVYIFVNNEIKFFLRIIIQLIIIVDMEMIRSCSAEQTI